MDEDSCPSCGTLLDQMVDSPTSGLCPDAFVPNRSKQRQRDSPLLSKKSLRSFKPSCCHFKVSLHPG